MRSGTELSQFLRILVYTYLCISELFCLCCVGILKTLPVHPFIALIIPAFWDYLLNYLSVFLSFGTGTVLEVTN